MIQQDAIVFDRITKTFPGTARPAVSETNLVIERGAFVTIVGSSGSGKTTLLKMVNRIIEPTSGTIYLFGTDIRQKPVTELRRSIGYVIQQIGLFPHMTIEENIATVPRILGWSRQTIEARVNFLLDLVRLPASYKKRYPRQLSGGQQQRVGIARAMAGDPDVLLMDEPFGAIDAITRKELQDEFLAIQKQLVKTVLFVTHDMDEALKLGDRIVVMHEGKVLQYGPPFHILSQPATPFVSRLTQSDNLFRQLDLIKASEKMIPLNGREDANAPHIHTRDSLKKALQTLLQTNADDIIVIDDAGQRLGKITLEQLRLTDR
ncbi:MAG: L-proline glycine betaine ABC transport system permease protein ProV [Candidatus Carbobacillus altaicus]|uniref:Carnitine transport ATP-binding protein OpuCA n=1 Tax=Candidatus Carbonibacillus altaicus TaxID=2163959 RepID=A0A2R6Y478_9BACL|nr:MAG: L-proline glycine betaine ABC transport system permease protein ProV [Candidatus Carbobacillus altaicus]